MFQYRKGIAYINRLLTGTETKFLFLEIKVGPEEKKLLRFLKNRKNTVLRSKKTIKDVEMEEEIDFEYLKPEILEMEKNVVTKKELKFAFAQPTNWDNFSNENDSESQEDENDSRSQVLQREHMINKTQEVWVNK